MSELLIKACNMGYFSAVRILVKHGAVVTLAVLNSATFNCSSPERHLPHKRKQYAQIMRMILMSGIDQKIFERLFFISTTGRSMIKSMAHQTENCY